MLNLLNITTPVIVDGVTYSNSAEAYEALKGTEGQIRIQVVQVQRDEQQDGWSTTTPDKSAEATHKPDSNVDDTVYRIQVKQYMLEASSPGFDFMLKWNQDIPMPLVIMKGTILEETKGMIRMNLTATPEPSTHCFKCGRKLTNKVSVLYGIGPECGGHFSINPLSSEAALQDAMDDIKMKMAKLKWQGWIPKSAIKELIEV